MRPSWTDLSAPEEDLTSGGTGELANLPPLLRVLLVTDGTVTQALGAYYGEPIRVEVLLQRAGASDEDLPPIGVKTGDPITRRRVLLMGRASGTIYALAESVLAHAAFTPAALAELATDPRGIGGMLQRRKLETYREVHRAWRGRAGACAAELGLGADNEVVGRSYSIRLGGASGILITEIFPLAAFV